MYLSKRLTRVFCLAICFLIVLPTSVFAAQTANDYSGHWSGKQVKSFVEKGFVSLYSDGSFKPDVPITRADFVSIANKAFALKEKDNTNFKDVKPGDTFYNDFLIAREAGYITGTPEGMALPKGYMTRQEYAVIIARLLKLDTKKDMSAADKFADASDMPIWSRGSIGAVYRLGYMGGEPGNKFNPKGYVTRGQAVAVLERCFPDSVKVAYNKAGTYSEKLIEGNVEINVPDVKLENTTITGSLTIGGGVGSGNATLKNVVVKGDMIVKGGGLNSIIIEDSQLRNIIIIKEDSKVRVVTAGSTSVERVDMQSGGKLEEQGTSGKGFGYVTITESVDPNEPVILKGNFESVQVQADGVKLDVESGSIAKLDVASTAANTHINLAAGTSVAAISVNAATSVTGKGTVGAAQVNVQGATITAPVTTITKAPGITVVTTVPNPTAPPATSGSSGGRSGGRSGGSSGDGGGSGTPAISTVKPVTANPVAGAVDAGTQVALSTETAGADIYYTLDGTEPSASSTKYTGPITIDKNKTIKAIGLKSGMNNSAVATFGYAVLIKVEAGKPVTFDNGTQVDGLPAGASIAASEATIAPKPGIAAAGKAMDFTFSGTMPAEGVALKLPTTSDDAGLSYYNTARGKWELQEGSAVITEGDKKFVKATVTHFSTYGPIVKSAQLVADSITSVKSPVKDASSLTLPAVPEGFDIAISSSDNIGVIALNGAITLPANETKVNIRLKVTRASDSTIAETVAMEVVVPARTPVLTAIGAISGTPKAGEVLTAGELTPAGATASYQWQICDTADGTYTDIAGAATNKYTPVAGDAGKYIKVTATGTGSYTGTVTSAPTEAIAAAATLTEITGFDKIADIEVGIAGSAPDITALPALLPTTVTANGGTVTVPVVGWSYIDGYDPALAGSYTCNAVLGTIPEGYANSGNHTATVEVIVSPIAAPEVTVSSVVVKTAPTKVEYTEGETLDLTGLAVTLTMSDSSTVDVAFADFAANGITTSKVNGAVLAASDTEVIITVNGKVAAQAIVVAMKDNFLSSYSAGFTENAKELSFTVNLQLTEAIDTSKLKYMTSQNGDYYYSLTGPYTRVANTEPLSPGQYCYHGSASETTILLKLTDADADAIKSLPGYGNDGELVNTSHDRLAAESGWYPGAGPGIKVVTINNLVFVMNSSSLHTVNAVYLFDSNNVEISSKGVFPSADLGSGFTILAGPRVAKIVFYEGTYDPGVTPISGSMAIVQATPDIITNGVTLEDSHWTAVDETNFGKGGGSGTIEIFGFDGIPNVDAGAAGAALYANTAAVQAALPATVTANGGAVTVPVVEWTDTDGYNPARGGFYTFTAILGTIQEGYTNTGNHTAAVEVVIATEYASVGVLTNPIVSVANGTMEFDVKAALDKTVEVIGKCGETGTANISWTLEGYKGFVSGDYTATGALSLPTAWIGNAGTVTATVKVQAIQYASVKALANNIVPVSLGATEEYAEGALDATVEVLGTNGETDIAAIAWTIAGYNGNAAGDYEATGVLTLPVGWTGTPETVTAIVRVQGISYSHYDTLAIGSITVPGGTTEADAKNMLNPSVTVYGASGEIATATITWAIEGYDENTAGGYTAIGTLVLPTGWTGTPEDVIVTVTVQAMAYSYTQPLANAEVTMLVGTAESSAIAALDPMVGIVGTNGETDTAAIAWTLEGYDGNVAGDYMATGVLTLPAGWTGTPENVTAIVTLVEPIIYSSTDVLTIDTASVVVGTPVEGVIELLDKYATVYGTNGETGYATIAWDIANYDPSTVSDYTATGILTLPDGWTGTPETVTATVSVKEPIVYSSTQALNNGSITVQNGTSIDDALAALDLIVEVLGAAGEIDYATIAWTIEGYDGNAAGDYTATGVLTLPDGWAGTAGDVTATVTVLP